MFLSDELFWDQKEERVYSDKYIQIKRGETELKGYGFESNQEMTEYRIFRPHDGIIPFKEEPFQPEVEDSVQSEMEVPKEPELEKPVKVEKNEAVEPDSIRIVDE